MVRANPLADAIEPAPESLQGLLRLAAQLESLADSPALNRAAAARSVLPPAPDANYSLVESAPPPKLATSTGLLVTTTTTTLTQPPSLAPSPGLSSASSSWMRRSPSTTAIASKLTSSTTTL